MVIDGKGIAESIYTELSPKLGGRGRKGRLGIVVAGANPVIESFVSIKTRSAERLGIEMVRINLSEHSDAGKVLQAIARLVHDTDAVIVQLPLPQGLSTNEMLSAVPKEKDVDALNPHIPEEERLVHAPVALAAVQILQRSNVQIA